MWLSLIVVSFPVTDIISSVDREVSCVNIVAFHSCLKKLRLMHSPVGSEVQLLVLNLIRVTLVLIPHTLNSYSSTDRRYCSWPSAFKNSALSRSSKRRRSQVRGLQNMFSIQYMQRMLPRVLDSTLQTRPPLKRKIFWGQYMKSRQQTVRGWKKKGEA